MNSPLMHVGAVIAPQKLRDALWRHSPENTAWRNGQATCPDCRRFGCKGQCGCTFGPGGKPCVGCSQPLDEFRFEDCEHARASRARSAPGGREAAHRAYREELVGAGESRVSWGECIAQVERVGCPHVTAAAARKPEAKGAILGAKHWWSEVRTRQPLLVLSSATGTGKSVAAAHLASKYAELRKWWVAQASGVMQSPLVWMQADEVARLALIPDATQAFLERAQRSELLVVDELSPAGAKAGLLALGELLRSRADSGRLTIVTTNATSAELEPLGAHVVDRLKRAHVVRVREESMRGKR